MATDSGDIVEDAVSATLAEIEKYAPQEFQQLQADQLKKETLMQAAREAAEEEVKLAEEFHTRPFEDVVERLSKYLPKHRMELIQMGPPVGTYRLDITKAAEDQYKVVVTSIGKPFMEQGKMALPSVVVDTSRQIAITIVEAALLFLRAVGVSINVSERAVRGIAEGILPTIGNSTQVQQTATTLLEVMQGSSNLEVAKYIIKLIKACWDIGILWQVIRGLCVNMNTWDWIKTAGIVSAVIFTACTPTTYSVSLIVKIALVLNSYPLKEKIGLLRRRITSLL